MTDIEQAAMRHSLRDFMEDWYDRWAGPGEDWTLADMADSIVDTWLAEYLLSDDSVEKAAKALASLEPGEDWPSNEALGGSLTGTRDDEYRDSKRDEVHAALSAALGKETS